MKNTPKGLRLHIGIFGKRNVGKSSLLNAITRQNVSIVSDVAGTTTDPVEKPMEILPIGPVQFIDTAGIDDIGAIGEARIKKTLQVIERTDVAILVAIYDTWDDFENKLIDTFAENNTPVIVVFNKTDIFSPNEKLNQQLKEKKIIAVDTVAIEKIGIDKVIESLIQIVPEKYLMPSTIVGDLISPGALVVLVVPIDLEAPKGRLILPQVQTIRDILDNDAYCLVVKERELRDALDRLKYPPALVVTDSQAFLKVSGDTPDEIPLTSFSILFARLKGDLETFVKGALAIDKLKPGDRILIAEACAHHPIGEDIGRVKIPRWLRQYVGGDLHFDHIQGHDFPDDISKYSLIVHCGACTFNPKNLLSRIVKCKEAGVPITNYGVAIAYTLGIFERALKPFPLTAEIMKY
jgi:[FeFe] hydrogenase H-cluster maturation GTPase HydF